MGEPSATNWLLSFSLDCGFKVSERLLWPISEDPQVVSRLGAVWLLAGPFVDSLTVHQCRYEVGLGEAWVAGRGRPGCPSHRLPPLIFSPSLAFVPNRAV